MGENAVARTIEHRLRRTGAYASSLPPRELSHSEKALARLDAELEAFSRYVQLSVDEIEARRFVINHVKELASNLFGGGSNAFASISATSGKKKRRRLDTWSDCEVEDDKADPNGPDDSVRVELFGSFSSPEVCTFLSDVDLVLWGVVPPDKCGTQTHFEEEYNGSEDEGQNMSHSALERTMEPLISVNEAGDSPAERDAASPLFMIDRVGEGGEGIDLASDESEGKEATKQEVIDLASNEGEGKKATEKEVIVLASNEGEGKGAIEKEVIDLASDEEDDADKMEHFRKKSTELHKNNARSEHRGIVGSIDRLSRKTMSLGESDDEFNEEFRQFVESNSSNSAINDSEDGDLNVSLVVKPSKTKPLTGDTRNKVVRALQRLGKKLWASSLSYTVEVRRHARVPIVTMETRLGFDGDIAIGGHNGADTSRYAASQISRYESFAPVVLLLKIILYQTDLDKPFTGGLGSYKLYVLVAHHLEKHIATGGFDHTAEVLLSFLFRYGDIKGKQGSEGLISTLNGQSFITTKDGGNADLAPVFRIKDCVEVFGLCFLRLRRKLADAEGAKGSFLSNTVDCAKLKNERDKSIVKSKVVETLRSSTVARDHPGKVTPGRRINFVFPRSSPNESKRRKASAQVFPARESDTKRSKQESAFPPFSNNGSDEEADRLMAGYGLQRGPRGTIVPRNRPDVEAKRPERNNPVLELFARASKNRKNKKKQNRDKAISEFTQRLPKGGGGR